MMEKLGGGGHRTIAGADAGRFHTGGKRPPERSNPADAGRGRRIIETEGWINMEIVLIRGCKGTWKKGQVVKVK